MKKSIPIKVWLWVVFWLVVFQTVVKLDNHFVVIAKHIQKLEIEKQVKDFSVKTDTGLNIAFIGSSRLRSGLNDVNVNQLNNIDVYKLCHSGRNLYKYLFETNLVQRLKKNKIDVLMLESALFADLEKPNYINKEKKQKDVLLNVKNQLKENNSFITRVLSLFRSVKSVKVTTKTDKIIVDSINVELRKAKFLKQDKLLLIKNKITEIEALGVKIILVDIPLPHQKEKRISKTKFGVDYQNYLINLGCDYWQYTGEKMFYRYYYDNGHLNTLGQKKYTNWFTSKLKSLY